jgi:L-ascorbate metabolism protein UlaG (beta-lactamase superfamily)
MAVTRRGTLGLGAGALAAAGLGAWAGAGRAQAGDVYPTESGEIRVHPVEHASLVMEVPGQVIYVDPVGGAEAYAGLPAPDLILVTHEHGDHFDAATLQAIAGEAQIVTNPAVHAMLPEALKGQAHALANGESTSVGGTGIEAIPAYNTTEGRLQYHPQGRDNGYLLSIDGRRVYVAGDTEDIPEMRSLEDIDIAFVPMNPPYTMSVEQAASAVNDFAPDVVYPYHYHDSDIDAFARLVEEGAGSVEVVRGDWYAAA